MLSLVIEIQKYQLSNCQTIWKNKLQPIAADGCSFGIFSGICIFPRCQHLTVTVRACECVSSCVGGGCNRFLFVRKKGKRKLLD